MRKKYITLIVIASLTLMALSACTVNTAETTEPSKAVSFYPDITDEAFEELIQSITPVSPSPSPVAAPQESVASNAPPPEASPLDEGFQKIKRGEWKMDISDEFPVYTNETFGIQYILPHGWFPATDDEIANLMDLTLEMYREEAGWLLETGRLKTLYDVFVSDPVSGNNVIISFENLAQTIGGTRMSEEDYLYVYEKQTEYIESLDYEFSEPFNVTICGKEYLGVTANELINGSSQHLFFLRHEDYMIIIIVSVFDDMDVNIILNQFV